MISYPQAVLNWVMAQTSTGGWTIEEWHSHYSSFDQDSWAAYYSAHVVVKGRQYEPEEWAEFMQSADFRVDHPLIGTLLELGEYSLIEVLEGARAAARRSDGRRRTAQKFSPY